MRTTAEGISIVAMYLCVAVILCVFITSCHGCNTQWEESSRLKAAIKVVQDGQQPAMFYQDSEGRWVFKFGEIDE